MNNLLQEVEVAGVVYVVMAVDAQTQYKIFQKIARYGVSTLVAEMVKVEEEGGDIKMAFVKTLLAVVQLMPEDDQDFCLESAMMKTFLVDESEPVDISDFCGRISEYVLLGVRAIGVQLGDFSCFLGLINDSIADEFQECDE